MVGIGAGFLSRTLGSPVWCNYVVGNHIRVLHRLPNAGDYTYDLDSPGNL
jgi:hypothetical protein